ncbi:hypothetical protein BpHYR1_012688 [Brachionus plicatilis]|uniref:Uncharacterized protein n=1 Tax=Brachionus plicatilis TaxID=10195 RepID=A0A3M7SMR4_BRAPC|nr:hypothetical protein BpHYR1_012688 [Brachionus plicatilis]
MHYYNERYGTSTLGRWNYRNNFSPAQAAQMDLEYRIELERQERNYVERILLENYPSKFVVVYSCLTIAIGITLIILQIVYFASNGNKVNAGSGIWTDGLLASSIILWRKQSLINLTGYFCFFAIFISLPAIFLNIACITFSENQNAKSINIAMIVLVAINIALLITFFAVLSFYSKKYRPTESIDLHNFSFQDRYSQNTEYY